MFYSVPADGLQKYKNAVFHGDRSTQQALHLEETATSPPLYFPIAHMFAELFDNNKQHSVLDHNNL